MWDVADQAEEVVGDAGQVLDAADLLRELQVLEPQLLRVLAALHRQEQERGQLKLMSMTLAFLRASWKNCEKNSIQNHSPHNCTACSRCKRCSGTWRCRRSPYRLGKASRNPSDNSPTCCSRVGTLKCSNLQNFVIKKWLQSKQWLLIYGKIIHRNSFVQLFAKI